MQYNLSINQYAIITQSHPLTLEDIAILNVIWYAFASTKFKKLQDDGFIYTWIAYKRLIDELPILGKPNDDGSRKPPSKSKIYKLIKRLVDLGYLHKHKDNALMNQSFFCSTDKLDSIFSNITKTTPSKKSDPYENLEGVPPPENAYPLQKIIGAYENLEGVPYENLEGYHNTNKHSDKSITYREEFLNVFDVFKKYSGNDFSFKEQLMGESDKYKKFAAFWHTHKEVYSLDEIKRIIKFACEKNFGTKDQQYSRPENFFIKRSFDIYHDQYITHIKKQAEREENSEVVQTPAKVENIPLDAVNLKLYKQLSEKVNDDRFTTSVFYASLQSALYNQYRHRGKTVRMIIKAIKEAITDSSKAYNKNRLLSDLIKEKLNG